MKLHIVTIGKPKLSYAIEGWNEYYTRLSRFHEVRTTQLSDKYADDAAKIMSASEGSYRVILEIEGKLYSSQDLATFLEKRELESREVSFIIGGPNGLPQEIRQAADTQLSLGGLTLPHDLAMVVTLEALYRASTINAHIPYHR